MINNLKQKDITKREILQTLKDKLKKEKEQSLRNILSEKSFEMPEWSKYLAHQLGYLAALEELDNFVPDPESIND